MAALEARKQGGLVVYVHPLTSPQNDVMDSNLGAKEAQLTAALGAMDAMDILPFGPAAYELWYRLLNSGFQIAPGAGTDVFTNWRGINRIPGGAREYVQEIANAVRERYRYRYVSSMQICWYTSTRPCWPLVSWTLCFLHELVNGVVREFSKPTYCAN
jgi:hypothetical protein